MELEEINAVLIVLGGIVTGLLAQQVVNVFIPPITIPDHGINGDITIDDIGVSMIDDHLCYGIWWMP